MKSNQQEKEGEDVFLDLDKDEIVKIHIKKSKGGKKTNGKRNFKN